MLIHGINLQSLLSFGPRPESMYLAMKPLNVLIGPNGSGKSNLIEAISLLQAAPRDIATVVRESSDVEDWVWKGSQGVSEPTVVSALVKDVNKEKDYIYFLAFSSIGNKFEVAEEIIANPPSTGEGSDPYVYFQKRGTLSKLNHEFNRSEELKLEREEIDPEQSILSQLKSTLHYPVLTYIGNQFNKIKIYREWSLGRLTPPRLYQQINLPNDFLSENCSNLGPVLSQLIEEPIAKAKLLDALKELYADISDIGFSIKSGEMQVNLQEGDITIPATRLSDGTLRYLCLLAILLHPNPPPLICIEEPELGLHPDILPTIADLLVEASERCQLVVTTHSEVLVDALTDTPESIVVCEKHQGQTTMRRLDKDDLAKWLEKYRLGELWTSGELGGNRW